MMFKLPAGYPDLLLFQVFHLFRWFVRLNRVHAGIGPFLGKRIGECSGHSGWHDLRVEMRVLNLFRHTAGDTP
jgi:hypothetical protein